MNITLLHERFWKKLMVLLTVILMESLFIFSNLAYAANPNLIINASFETDDFTDPIQYPNGFTSSNGTFIGLTYNVNTLTGWTFTQNIDGWAEGGTRDWAPAFDGTQYIDLIGNNNVTRGVSNILSQVIHTVPGKTYSFSFHWGEDVGHSPPEVVTLIARVIDSNNSYILNHTLTKNAVGSVSGHRGPNNWDYFEKSFIATTAQTTIQFSAIPPGNGDTSAGAALDMVTVSANQLSTIPTLGEWGLLWLVLLLTITGYLLKPEKNNK